MSIPTPFNKDELTIAVIGDGNTGKTSLIRSFLRFKFENKVESVLEPQHFDIDSGIRIKCIDTDATKLPDTRSAVTLADVVVIVFDGSPKLSKHQQQNQYHHVLSTWIPLVNNASNSRSYLQDNNNSYENDDISPSSDLNDDNDEFNIEPETTEEFERSNKKPFLVFQMKTKWDSESINDEKNREPFELFFNQLLKHTNFEGFFEFNADPKEYQYHHYYQQFNSNTDNDLVTSAVSSIVRPVLFPEAPLRTRHVHHINPYQHQNLNQSIRSRDAIPSNSPFQNNSAMEHSTEMDSDQIVFTTTFTNRARRVFEHIFFIADCDGDGFLNGAELEMLHRRAFGTLLTDDQAQRIKSMLKRRAELVQHEMTVLSTPSSSTAGIMSRSSKVKDRRVDRSMGLSVIDGDNGGLTLTGLLLLVDELLDQRQAETVWGMIQAYGYDVRTLCLDKQQEIIEHCVSNISLDALYHHEPNSDINLENKEYNSIVELSSIGIDAFTTAFRRFSVPSKDYLSREQLITAFSMVPDRIITMNSGDSDGEDENDKYMEKYHRFSRKYIPYQKHSSKYQQYHPFGCDEYLDFSETNTAGNLTLAGWIALWQEVVGRCPADAVIHLLYWNVPQNYLSPSLFIQKKRINGIPSNNSKRKGKMNTRTQKYQSVFHGYIFGADSRLKTSLLWMHAHTGETRVSTYMYDKPHIPAPALVNVDEEEDPYCLVMHGFGSENVETSILSNPDLIHRCDVAVVLIELHTGDNANYNRAINAIAACAKFNVPVKPVFITENADDVSGLLHRKTTRSGNFVEIRGGGVTLEMSLPPLVTSLQRPTVRPSTAGSTISNQSGDSLPLFLSVSFMTAIERILRTAIEPQKSVIQVHGKDIYTEQSLQRQLVKAEDRATLWPTLLVVGLIVTVPLFMRRYSSIFLVYRDDEHYI